MDHLSRAWGLITTTSRFCYTVARSVGQYVTAASGYAVTWTTEYAMKRRRGVGQRAAAATDFSCARRSSSPPQRRLSGSRSPTTTKKAKETQERRVNRIVSQSMRSKNKDRGNEKTHASQEVASFSASSPPALHAEPVQFCINENDSKTPPKNDTRYSTLDELSGKLFEPILASTPTIFSSSPDHGTPPLSQSSVEDMAASIPGALSPYYPNSPTLYYTYRRARKRNVKLLGGRQVSKSLHGAREVPKYDSGVRKAYCTADEQRRPLKTIDKNALANKNTLMKQYRLPRGLQVIKDSRNESLARTSRRSQEARKFGKEKQKKTNKENKDPRLNKFHQPLTRFARAGERRKFAELQSVSLVAAPLAPSPRTTPQQWRTQQQSLQHYGEHIKEEEVALVRAASGAVEPEIPQQESNELDKQEQQDEEQESPTETAPLPSASASSPGTPQQIESQELSHLEDAPPLRTPKRVHWNTTAFTSPQVIPKVKYYIKDEKITYPSIERLDPEYRNPHTSQPQIPDDFSLINDEQSLDGTPVINVFEKYDTPEPVEGETSELEALRLGVDDFHVSTRYKVERDRHRKVLEEERLKKEAERKALKDKIRAAEEEAEKERKRIEQAEREAAEAEAKAKAEKEEQAKAAAAAASQKLIYPLGPEMSAKVEKAMATHNKSSILAQTRGIELSRKDFGTLLPQSSPTARDGIGWLNDEIVNGYIGAAVDRHLEKLGFDRKKMGGQAPPMHAFNTNWYNTVSTKGTQAVARWSKRAKLEGAKLLEVEQILFPINDGNHWTLLTISGTKRQIWYLDSLGGKGKNYVETAKSWLKMELKEGYVDEEWKVVGGGGGREEETGRDWTSPRQDNGVDCGVFTCFNALAVVRGALPAEAYSAADMWNARRQIAGTLLQGGFSGEFDWA